jgi:hypothetical protein
MVTLSFVAETNFPFPSKMMVPVPTEMLGLALGVELAGESAIQR